MPKGRFFDKSKEEGSTEGCKYREIRKSHLAQEIPELKIGGGRERAQGKYHICLLSSSS